MLIVLLGLTRRNQRLHDAVKGARANMICDGQKKNNKTLKGFSKPMNTKQPSDPLLFSLLGVLLNRPPPPPPLTLCIQLPTLDPPLHPTPSPWVRQVIITYRGLNGSRIFQFANGNFNSVAHGNLNFAPGNFNFAHGNFNFSLTEVRVRVTFGTRFFFFGRSSKVLTFN